jgi:predicted neuraminidase
MRRNVIAIAALAGCLASGLTLARAPSWPDAFELATPPQCLGRAVFDVREMRAVAPRYAHAASAILLRDGRLRAFWYEGAEELGDDVKIWSAVFDGERWGTPAPVIGPQETAASEGIYVAKIGNAVPYRNADGDLVLIYATVGIGGWSGASLNVMHSRDDGATWSAPRRLITSATLNFSTLVRSPVIALKGGFALVPAYQEFLAKFPELLLLDRYQNVVGRRRLPGAKAIQPSLAILDRRRARAFSRTRVPRAIPWTETRDAGATWSASRDTNLPGYDKPLAVTNLGNGSLLAVYNAGIPGAPVAYGPMAIGISDDEGATWRTIHTLHLDPQRTGSAHYPWIVVGADGLFHLLFTRTLDRGSTLMHVRFSRDWIATQGGPPCR